MLLVRTYLLQLLQPRPAGQSACPILAYLHVGSDAQTQKKLSKTRDDEANEKVESTSVFPIRGGSCIDKPNYVLVQPALVRRASSVPAVRVSVATGAVAFFSADSEGPQSLSVLGASVDGGLAGWRVGIKCCWAWLVLVWRRCWHWRRQPLPCHVRLSLCCQCLVRICSFQIALKPSWRSMPRDRVMYYFVVLHRRQAFISRHAEGSRKRNSTQAL
ncbi:hypothetical protein BKA81DRAFT_356806 [Phyllosticta paracitricarpa]